MVIENRKNKTTRRTEKLKMFVYIIMTPLSATNSTGVARQPERVYKQIAARASVIYYYCCWRVWVKYVAAAFLVYHVATAWLGGRSKIQQSGRAYKVVDKLKNRNSVIAENAVD